MNITTVAPKPVKIPPPNINIELSIREAEILLTIINMSEEELFEKIDRRSPPGVKDIRREEFYEFSSMDNYNSLSQKIENVKNSLFS